MEDQLFRSDVNKNKKRKDYNIFFPLLALLLFAVCWKNLSCFSWVFQSVFFSVLWNQNAGLFFFSFSFEGKKN